MGFHTFWTLLASFFMGARTRRRAAACCLLLLAAGGATGAEPIRLNALGSQSLGRHADVLVEAGEALNLAEARERYRSGRFRPGERPVLTFGIGSAPVWVRLEVENPTGQALPLRLTLGTTWIDRLDVYVAPASGPLTSWQTGDRQANAYGLTPVQGFVFAPVFPPGRSEIYLRAETDDPLVLPLMLTPVDMARADHWLHHGYGFLYGFLIALAVYNAMLYVGSRKRGHLYYALYLLSFILLNLSYTGHGYAWWWSMAPGFQRYVILIMMVACSCSGLLFAGRILSLSKYAPRTLRGINGFSLAGLGLLGMSLALDSQYGAALLAFSFLTVFTVLMVVLGVMMVRRGQAVGRYFLAATLSGMLGMMATDLAVWGWIPFNPLTFHAIEIGVLIESTLFSLALAAQVRQSDAARRNAEQLARIDTLTGLHNRRAFFELAQPTLSTAERNSRPFSLIMLDVDHFKRINDRYGHGVGDQVLIEVARLLRQSCRAGDVLARWGGEEFVMLLPETNLQQASFLAERIRQQLAATRLLVRDKHIAFTASLGVAEYGQQTTLDGLIHEADMRLYEAKNNGRNQVCAQLPGTP